MIPIKKKDQTVEDYVKELAYNTYPFIGWDWDGTLSFDRYTIHKPQLEIMKQLTRELGVGHIIVTSRSEDIEVIGWDERLIPNKPSVIFNEKVGDNLRFKMWVLKSFYRNGRGPLRLYIENNNIFVDYMRKSGLPVFEIYNLSFQRICQFLHVLKKIS